MFPSPKAGLTHILSFELCKMQLDVKVNGASGLQKQGRQQEFKVFHQAIIHMGIYVTNGDRGRDQPPNLVFQSHLHLPFFEAGYHTVAALKLAMHSSWCQTHGNPLASASQKLRL